MALNFTLLTLMGIVLIYWIIGGLTTLPVMQHLWYPDGEKSRKVYISIFMTLWPLFFIVILVTEFVKSITNE